MYRLRNFMEDAVTYKTNDILKTMDICKCEKCKLDIVAIALNDLPPKYVVSQMGELFAKVNELTQQFEVDIESAIVKAATQVANNPKHDVSN